MGDNGSQPSLKVMARRFALLDRDGTIIADRHYLADPDGVELLPGAAAGLRHLHQLGLGLAVVTNQSGVGRGLFSMAQVAKVNQRMGELLAAQGVQLDGIYVCPHAPEAGCGCRKPQPGLALAASRQLGFSPQEALVVGDRAADVELGRQLGATTFLVGARVGGQETEGANPDYTVENLMDVAAIAASLPVMAIGAEAAVLGKGG